jgi:autotransporter passenger strand-loop-strand repeat protein
MTIISSGQTLAVSSGQIDTGDIVRSGGTLDVLSGGTEISASISGVENDFGITRSSTVFAGGVMNVFAGGTADHLLVSSGGTLDVLGAITSNTRVLSGGVENISSGGLISGAPNSGTSVSGGMLNVLAGGTAEFFSVSGSSGVANVSGTAESPILPPVIKRFHEFVTPFPMSRSRLCPNVDYVGAGLLAPWQPLCDTVHAGIIE